MEGEEADRALAEGVDLFNHGYFWEAHEAWEEPWQLAAKDDPRRLYLQGLIRLAAAALKYRMNEPRGVLAHAGWCRDVFKRLGQHPGVAGSGPGLKSLAGLARRLEEAKEPWAPEQDGANPCLETLLVPSRRPPEG